MARQKEFDRDAALNQAIDVFAQHGFEGSSTTELLHAMQISRQSLYDTFGDKWRLYLEAVQRYASDSIGVQLATLEGAATAIGGVEALLLEAATRAAAAPAPACLGIGAICEFGRSEPELVALNESLARWLNLALERRLRQAKDRGDTAADLDIEQASRFLMATMIGIKVSARQGASSGTLIAIARMALKALD